MQLWTVFRKVLFLNRTLGENTTRKTNAEEKQHQRENFLMSRIQQVRNKHKGMKNDNPVRGNRRNKYQMPQDIMTLCLI
ncbi:hypothetical protein AV530_011741 [Patagioenas fasciata monilis]|uniref:Uncharacterized protein n=1 Tax=Patagioenas fasciata monilis TaxID=372326 RepID=A0A1V4KNE3_PATFA|nr:hypothetical protein AV530_011741 [Patagioenas fasciata monilis]